MASVWWVWMAAGVALGLLELLAPAYVFLGFSLGAFAVGVALWMGLSLALPWLLLIASVIALVAWLALRAAMGVRKGQVKVWDRDINED